MRLTAVTHDILGDPFWMSFVRGLEDAARLVGCAVEHVRPPRYSVEAMTAALEHAIAGRPDGLLTTLPDPAALDSPVRRAIHEGLPVIVLNTLDRRATDPRLPVLCSIAADDRAGGVIAAERVLGSGPCHRALCVDHYRVPNTCHAQRIEGFCDRLRLSGAHVASLAVDGEDLDDAARRIEDALAAAEGGVDAILTVGPPGWRAADRALARAVHRDRITHVTFDLTVEVLDAIERRRTLGAVDCQQYLQGYLGVVTMSCYLDQGVAPCGEVLTGPHFVDLATIPRVRARTRAGVFR